MCCWVWARNGDVQVLVGFQVSIPMICATYSHSILFSHSVGAVSSDRSPSGDRKTDRGKYLQVCRFCVWLHGVSSAHLNVTCVMAEPRDGHMHVTVTADLLHLACNPTAACACWWALIGLELQSLQYIVKQSSYCSTHPVKQLLQLLQSSWICQHACHCIAGPAGCESFWQNHSRLFGSLGGHVYCTTWCHRHLGKRSNISYICVQQQQQQQQQP